jgi:hypothetical protein
MKNLMLVAAACIISALALAHTQAQVDVPRSYIIQSGACLEIPRPGCTTSGMFTCSVTLADNVTYSVYGSSTTTPCAFALYRN